MAHIRILDSNEAIKIAAGEVVDRPAALVREFMDNAIDSGAGEIDVCIEEGGLKCTEVIDNGCGMGAEDLKLACYKHATSKITCINDLQTILTLGFRGEALAAAAATAHLEIISSTDGKTAFKLFSRPEALQSAPGANGNFSIKTAARTKGTTVKAFYLFDTIPARKLFLKNPAGEAVHCKNIFTEKALAFPHIAFRFYQDSKLKLDFKKAGSLKQRFSDAVLSANEDKFLHEIIANSEHFSANIIVGGPELIKNNRRYQYIYANGRRINDFSLQQAMEYGTAGWFPNGTHPVGAIFIKIDGKYADFNVHPAKIEVHFADPQAIHHRISTSLRSFVQEYEIKAGAELRGFEFVPLPPIGAAQQVPDYQGNTLSKGWVAEKAEAEGAARREDFGAREALLPLEKNGKNEKNDLKYVGRAFGLFIVVERDDKLFVIDQHAAHERLLYERIIAGKIAMQELLVPIVFEADSAACDAFLRAKKDVLQRIGLVINGGGGHWQVDALPSIWKLDDGKTVREILNLGGSGANFAEHWASTVACHAAIKDGTYLDSETALALARDALNLPVLRCPHGRPFVSEISRTTLLKAVKRV
jgi:DNA mismatch repair protein MutL